MSERGAGRRQRIAVLGGGLAGVTAAWQLAQHERARGGFDVRLFEASCRLGGTVETIHRDGFTIECGPDGWVSEKPWARELARELGLEAKLVGSNDGDRVTYILTGGKLVAIPNGMRLMVPTQLEALAGSSLFSEGARAAYAAEPERADELWRAVPAGDESIAAFVRRHFGDEILTKIAAPLLSGVFGGDVAKLSVRAVMPAFVAMEREYGSLIVALRATAGKGNEAARRSTFTSLTQGTQALIDRMAAELPHGWLRLSVCVTQLAREVEGWQVETALGKETFDEVMIALPAHVTRELLAPCWPRMAELHEVEASSAVIAVLAFTEEFELPKGFGFLVPAAEASSLLAATFVDQKYSNRAPSQSRLIRAFFGGEGAERVGAGSDDEIAALALAELQKILGPLPVPAFHVIRRWPRSLPQYAVGHLDRMAELESLRRAEPGLWLLGNTYRGVGLPDLIRDARAAAHDVARVRRSFAMRTTGAMERR